MIFRVGKHKKADEIKLERMTSFMDGMCRPNKQKHNSYSNSLFSVQKPYCIQYNRRQQHFEYLLVLILENLQAKTYINRSNCSSITYITFYINKL